MIKENFTKIKNEIPGGVELVVATKARSKEEIEAVIAAGAKVVGENYVKEAEAKYLAIGNKVKWHLIGHLQKNKAKFAVKIFDMIETVDSIELANVIDRESKKINKVMPVLIEVNSAKEEQKTGVLPQNLDKMLEEILKLKNVKLMGLMAMGPAGIDPEGMRPFFRETKELFEHVKNNYSNISDWKFLSMGMSESYNVAVEEGANIVRVGTAIFGRRSL